MHRCAVGQVAIERPPGRHTVIVPAVGMGRRQAIKRRLGQRRQPSARQRTGRRIDPPDVARREAGLDLGGAGAIDPAVALHQAGENEAFIIQPLIGAVDDEPFEDAADHNACDDQGEQGGDGGQGEQPTADRSRQQLHCGAAGASAVSR